MNEAVQEMRVTVQETDVLSIHQRSIGKLRGGFLHGVQATHLGTRYLKRRRRLAIFGNFCVRSRKSMAKMSQTRQVPSAKSSG